MPTTTKTAKTKKTATTKETAKTSKAPVKNGLRKPQERILKALADHGKLTRNQLGEAAQVDVAGCVEWIGSHDDAKREANDAKHFPSLVTLKLVRIIQVEGVRGMVYEATAAGKKQAAKIS